MSETKKKAMSAKRRLDLSSAAPVAFGGGRAKVRNPYLKAPKPTSTVAAVEGDVATASTVTPEAGIEKFFASNKAGDVKPYAARKLITPREDSVGQQQDGEPQQVKDRKRREEEDDAGLYYHSDEETRTNSKITKKAKVYEPGHIHSSVDYHHRGELPLDRGTSKAYRFIRNNFLIPRDIEADPKFGPHSGSCFEERVIRAYSLGQLETKDPNRSERTLLVCSYCGEEGHQRDDCTELL